MFYNNKEELGFDDVYIKPQLSDVNSRKDVSLDINYGNMIAKPIMVANMGGIATIKTASYLLKYKIPVLLEKYIDTKSLQMFLASENSKYSFITLGIDEYSANHIELLKDHPYANLDVANGYMSKFHNFVADVKNKYPDSFLICGNVCDSEGCLHLIKAGASCIKLNISQGSACNTAIKAGVGRLPISCIMECYDICKSHKVMICWDGGMKNPADMCKAIAAGANTVCSGSFFAPYREFNSNEQKLFPDGLKIKYFGMASKLANEKYRGKMESYKTSEGKQLWLDVKDNPEELIENLFGSLASTCSYRGCFSVKDLTYDS